MDALTDELSENMGPNSRYGIRLAAPEEDDVAGVLGSLIGVSKVEYVGSYEKATRAFIVEADKNVDIRRILFDECAKRNWYILMITPLGMSLEDIFIQLVNKNSEAKQLADKKEVSEEIKEEIADDSNTEA